MAGSASELKYRYLPISKTKHLLRKDMQLPDRAALKGPAFDFFVCDKFCKFFSG